MQKIVLRIRADVLTCNKRNRRLITQKADDCLGRDPKETCNKRNGVELRRAFFNKGQICYKMLRDVMRRERCKLFLFFLLHLLQMLRAGLPSRNILMLFFTLLSMFMFYNILYFFFFYYRQSIFPL